MGLVTQHPLPLQYLESQPPKNQRDTHMMLHVMMLPSAFLKSGFISFCKSWSWVIADGYDVLIEGKKV